MEEIWRDIPGYEGYYQVSNLARVRSVDRIVNRSYHKPRTQKLTGRLLTQSLTKGYPVVNICINGKAKPQYVHRLVASAFIPAIIGKTHINHINGVKNDNSISNLEWCSQKENNKHARETGLNKVENFVHRRGRDHPMAKLDETQVRTIRRCIQDGMTSSNLADYFKVHISTIQYIKSGKIWAGLMQA